MNNFPIKDNELDITFKHRHAKIDQGLSAVTAAVALPLAHPGMAPGPEGVLATVADVAIGGGAGPSGIEAVGGTRRQAEQALHHGLPLAAVEIGRASCRERV